MLSRGEQALQDPSTTPTSPSLLRIYALLSPKQQEQLHAASALRRSRQQQRTFANTTGCGPNRQDNGLDDSSEARRQSDNELQVTSETRGQNCAHTDIEKSFDPDNAGMCSQSF